ncbi:hypothetical protein QOT17_018012 [Balamuthia mandrillaris]
MEKAIAEAERKRKQEQREFLDNLQEAMEAAMKQAMEATKQTMEATKQAMEAVFDKERASNSLFSSSSSTSSTSSARPAKKTRKNYGRISGNRPCGVFFSLLAKTPHGRLKLRTVDQRMNLAHSKLA